MSKVIILLDNQFEDMEAMYPYYRMQEAGLEVEVVGETATVFHGKYGYPLKADKTPASTDLSGVEAVIIPGGHAPDIMRTKPEMVSIVKQAMDMGLIVAAICHGPQMLIEADCLRGRRATCYKAVKADLVNAGAKFEDAAVIVDGNLVTSRTPADLPSFCGAIVSMLDAAREAPVMV